MEQIQQNTTENLQLNNDFENDLADTTSNTKFGNDDGNFDVKRAKKNSADLSDRCEKTEKTIQKLNKSYSAKQE